MKRGSKLYCALGATGIVVGGIAVFAGVVLLAVKYPILEIIIFCLAGLSVLVLLGGMTCDIYDSCRAKHEERK